MPAMPEPLTSEERLALMEKFREMKHSINNTLAVIMALSELGQRNPVHLEKLAKAVLQRGPDVVAQLGSFQAMLVGDTRQEGAEDFSSPGAL